MPALEIARTATKQPPLNGKLAAMAAVKVDGQQVAIRRLTLDSGRSIKSTARELVESFGVDEADAIKQLNDLSVIVATEHAERQARAAAKPMPTRHIVDLADEFIRARSPEWHRNRRTLYLKAISAEVSLTELWTLVDQATVDRVASTIEGREAGDTGDLTWRSAIGLLRDALRIAGAGIVGEVVDVCDALDDATVHTGDLCGRLAHFLTRSRLVKLDCDTTSTSILEWAENVAPGESFAIFYADPVYARRLTADDTPSIGVDGGFLAAELKYQSRRKLAMELRAKGLADVECRLRTYHVRDGRDGRQRRAWLLSPVVFADIYPTEGAQ